MRVLLPKPRNSAPHSLLHCLFQPSTPLLSALSTPSFSTQRPFVRPSALLLSVLNAPPFSPLHRLFQPLHRFFRHSALPCTFLCAASGILVFGLRNSCVFWQRKQLTWQFVIKKWAVCYKKVGRKIVFAAGGDNFLSWRKHFFCSREKFFLHLIAKNRCSTTFSYYLCADYFSTSTKRNNAGSSRKKKPGQLERKAGTL